MRKPHEYISDLWTRARHDGELAPSSRADNGHQRDASTHLRRVMPDLYFVNTPAAHMVRHWGLLRNLPQENIQLDFYRHEGARLTNLTICSLDGATIGLLSKVCGTLSAFNIDVKSALIYSARGEDLQAELSRANIDNSNIDNSNIEYSNKGFDASRGVVLDTLVLSEAYRGRERAISTSTQREVESQIKRVLRDETTVAQLFHDRRARPLAPIVLHQLAAKRINGVSIKDSSGVSDSGDSDLILIKLKAQDSSGVLYRTTAALTTLGLNIRIAQINTHDGITDDTFYVSSDQTPAISEEECSDLAARLRLLLQ